jgi:hypothetical protein
LLLLSSRNGCSRILVLFWLFIFPSVIMAVMQQAVAHRAVRNSWGQASLGKALGQLIDCHGELVRKSAWLNAMWHLMLLLLLFLTAAAAMSVCSYLLLLLLLLLLVSRVGCVGMLLLSVMFLASNAFAGICNNCISYSC